MRVIPLPDGEFVRVSDRPTDDGEFAEPLPFGLDLDDAVAVRARDVVAGDLVLALTLDEGGGLEADHCPRPFQAVPRPVTECTCEGCEECAGLETWTLADHARVADLGWRYVCLVPAEGVEACVIERSNRPVVVVRAERVAQAEAADVPGLRRFTVTYSVEVEARSHAEALQLAPARVRADLDVLEGSCRVAVGTDGEER
ncbi:hypothetical protein [Streptomyces sp. bgisy060]|uniref:hypothetical protein n=1 Tax=Streptomyces sp. bgisy060 TaxID=3413775 RepID=UPI003EBA12BF